MSVSIRDKIHSFILTSSWQDFPLEVQRQSVMCFLDTLGVAASGHKTKLAKICEDFSVEFLNTEHLKQVPLLFSKKGASIAGAAFHGAAMIDSIDFHDGHRLTKGHAGVALIPTLYAVARDLLRQNISLTFEDIFSALIVGYEISLRAGIALHTTAKEYHTSGAWNTIGCAALTVRLLKGSQQQLLDALGIAEFYGPRSPMMRCIDYPTMLKDGSAMGAFSGVSAAYLAIKGFSGAPAETIYNTKCIKFFSNLYQNWEILQQYFKPYPVCRWAHAAITAVRSIQEKNSFNLKDIEKIDIFTFRESLKLAGKIPTNTEEAQYALAYPVAAQLLWKHVGLLEISPEAISNKDVISLVEKINIVEDAYFNKEFPNKRMSKVVIQFINGNILASGTTQARGDPENPMSFTELESKFNSNVKEVLPKNFWQEYFYISDHEVTFKKQDIQRFFAELSF